MVHKHNCYDVFVMSMYFKNREDAGRQIAEILFHPYGRSQSVILAMGPGGLLVGRPIALRLQIPMYMVATKEIDLPGTFHEQVGTVDQSGDFVYNSSLTQGQVDDYVAEYHNHIDSKKREAMHEINHMLGSKGFVDKGDLHEKNILLVSDGLRAAVDLDAIIAFLKPVKVMRMIGVAPVASIEAIDALHILTDEIRVLSPKENFLGTDHYYEENDLPDDEESRAIIATLTANNVA